MFLDYTYDSFLAQVMEEPIKGGALVNLMVTRRKNWLTGLMISIWMVELTD